MDKSKGNTKNNTQNKSAKSNTKADAAKKQKRSDFENAETKDGGGSNGACSSDAFVPEDVFDSFEGECSAKCEQPDLNEPCSDCTASEEVGQLECENVEHAFDAGAERDKYLRLAAEYDNFRKRSIKEKTAAYTDATANTILKLLPVYDNLERALKTECSDEAFYKGIEMTMTQMTEILQNMGVTMISAVGEVFDPMLHNAVMAIEDANYGEKIITVEYQKGFMLNERVIRFSTVVVAN